MRRSSATSRSSSSRRISACANASPARSARAPETERLAEDPHCGFGRGVLCLADEPLEAEQVELIRLHADQVARLPRHDHVGGCKRLPQLGDVVLERVAGCARGLCAPELVDQPIRGHHLVGGREEQGEQRPHP
jgi:hypothetical protein